jgi:Na+/H+ antiporter NhaD/arsenite permease-like protein
VLGAALPCWITGPVVGSVGHDAYILTLVCTIQEPQPDGVEARSLWWMMLWAGILGSSLTVAGAPALFAALNIGGLEENRRVSLRDLLSRDVPFTVVAAAVRYLIGMLISVRACAK